MVGKRFDAASPWVPVETFRHWTGDTLAALLEGGLLHGILEEEDAGGGQKEMRSARGYMFLPLGFPSRTFVTRPETHFQHLF